MRRPCYIFDVDGTLVDSNQMHVDTWKATANRYQLPCPHPEYIGKCGMKTVAVIQELLKWPVGAQEAERMGQEKEALYRQWIRDGGIRPIPGVLDFLHKAHTAGIRCAIGSSAPMENINACLDALHLRPFFDVVTSAEDVQRSKPAPDIYLKTAESLQAPPGDCLVFEDSPAGIQAARAASMRVIALLTSHSRQEVQQADRIVQDFTELDAAQPWG
ncbi:MAG: HAD family phosphatase [Verrucomicrobiota bacterium]|jgi:beta-phosphoglucomutase family hydrolase|nr:HAD family phosphatase [Verrucomicrobiota bacterium]